MSILNIYARCYGKVSALLQINGSNTSARPQDMQRVTWQSTGTSTLKERRVLCRKKKLSCVVTCQRSTSVSPSCNRGQGSETIKVLCFASESWGYWCFWTSGRASRVSFRNRRSRTSSRRPTNTTGLYKKGEHFVVLWNYSRYACSHSPMWNCGQLWLRCLPVNCKHKCFCSYWKHFVLNTIEYFEDWSIWAMTGLVGWFHFWITRLRTVVPGENCS